MDSSVKKQILELSDVELVRMLTVNAKESSPETLAVAAEEAHRRGVPIDEAFIPSDDPPRAAASGMRWRARGIPVRCGHCARDLFRPRGVLLNTRGLTFLGLDWLNQSAYAMECANCGLVQLFTEAPLSDEQSHDMRTM